VLSALAHHGPVSPSELWGAWNWDPLVWSALVVPAAVYVHLRSRAGRTSVRERWRRGAFLAGIVTAAVALVSPLDALSASLASAHMAQHLLLTTVAAPLLVLGAPLRTFRAGLPRRLRRQARRWRAALGVVPTSRLLAHPVAVSFPFVAVVWGWHARGPYDAALAEPLLHGLEHASFVGTALLSWAAILATARRSIGSQGTGVLVLFVLALQSGLLGLLLTFSTEPWYAAYAETAQEWGMTPLADQQLAGVLMWVPGGISYLAAAIALVVIWLRTSEARAAPAHRPTRAGGGADLHPRRQLLDPGEDPVHPDRVEQIEDVLCPGQLDVGHRAG